RLGEGGGPGDPVFLVARGELAHPFIDLTQCRAVAVEPARLAAAEQHAVDDPALADAARGTAQHEAVHGVEFALPLPLGLVDEAVEPPGDAVRRICRPV